MENHVVFPGLGLELDISRVAFSIGDFNVYWYGVIIAVGIFMVRKPELCWKLKHALDTEGGEPSKHYLATVTVLGMAMIIIPAVVILVSVISLILEAAGLG